MIMRRKNNVYSLQKIAETAGVSTATVSRALSRPELVKEITREKVLSALKALNIPIEEMQAGTPGASGRQKPVILVLLTTPNENLAEPDVLKGIYEVAQKNGYICVNMYREYIQKLSPDELKELLLQLNVIGIYVLTYLDYSILSLFSSMVPIVQSGDVNSRFESCLVMPDYYKLAMAATNHLIAQSCKDIAAIIVDTKISASSAKKQKGFCDALINAGRPIEASRIIELPKVDYLMTVNAVSSLLKRYPSVDGLFCGTDLYAAAALCICHQYNRPVPESIKIVGFDDTIYSSIVTPKITTTRHDRYYSGYIGCELLIERINNPTLPNEKIIQEGELIIRGSTQQH